MNSRSIRRCGSLPTTLLDDDDPLTGIARALEGDLVALPLEVLYDLSLAPAVRLADSGTRLDPDETDTLVESCWRAVRADR